MSRIKRVISIITCLAFIMINVPGSMLAYANTEKSIQSAEDLAKAFESFVQDKTKVKLNGNVVQINEPSTVTSNITVPEGVKLQIFAKMTVNSTITVNGIVQDSRPLEFRRDNGLVDVGSGKVEFNAGSSYYGQGIEIVGKENAFFNLNEGAKVNFTTGNKITMESGTITLTEGKNVTTDIVNKIIVNSGVNFVENGTIEPGIYGDETTVEPPVSGPVDPSNIKTAKDLYNYLITLVKDKSKVKVTSNLVELYESVTITDNIVIPARVKLQIMNDAADFKVDGKIEVKGIIQDSRQLDNRRNGLVGTGNGSVEFGQDGAYYQQGKEFISKSNSYIKLGANSIVTFYKENTMVVTKGSAMLSKAITIDEIKKIVVNEGTSFFAIDSYIGEGIIYIKPSEGKAALKYIVDLSQSNIENTIVSVDGNDIFSNKLWVTQEAKDAFKKSLDEAVNVLNNKDTDESEYVNAHSKLKESYELFNDSKEIGKKASPEITNADELVKALNSFGVSDAARNIGTETVGGKEFYIVEVLKPITIDSIITVPSNVRLKTVTQMTINSNMNIYGQLQDYRDEGEITGNGVVGSLGFGKAIFKPGSAMYIKGKGECIGAETGMIIIKEESELELEAKNAITISKGECIVNKGLPSVLTSEIKVNEDARLIVIGSIPSEVVMSSKGTFIDASIKNTENVLGIVGTTVKSSDESIATATIKDDRIIIEAKSLNDSKATITVEDSEGLTASIEVSVNRGAINEKKILKYGSKTPEELKKEIEEKSTLLDEMIKEAELKGLDAEREKGTLWFAKEFSKYADWDEKNFDTNKKMFGTISYSPGGKTAEDLAKELPEFERLEVIKMLDTSISELRDVIDGKIVRPVVNLVDWDGITLENGNFYSNGKPVFLHDYFSKPLDVAKDNETLYNHYLGNLDMPRSINPSFVTDLEGKKDQGKYPDLQNRPTNNNGYIMLWHDPVPNWLLDISGAGIKDGTSNFTKYDINSPLIRQVWQKVLENAIPETKDKPYTTLGYVLSNEPHWFLEEGHWGMVKKADGTPGISDYALADFAKWLEERHKDIKTLNELWKTNYASFDEASKSVIPLKKENINTAIGYDVSRWNMDRGTEWLTFIHDEVKKHDENANTHLKIMPDLFVEENRTHGIDFEALSKMTEILGSDAKTRKQNFKNTGASEKWSEDYAYFWEELAMAYDFMSSVSPEKANVNSEVHFLSTIAYRDLYMKPEYVRSTYWLATVLGMDAGLTWFWGRNPDGSIENRLMTTDNIGLLESYPASVAQQPRVANELSKTMMDLNSLSNDMVKFQEQEKPIRIFYTETSAINKSTHMKDLFGLYEKLYFNGTPIGFATKDIINDQQDKDLWEEVIVFKTPYVTDEEFDSLQEYLNNGGTVLIDDESLKFDEYQKPRTKVLEAGKGTLIKVGNSSELEISEVAFDQLSADRLPVLNITESNGLDQKGCIWRVVDGKDANHKVVTIMNVGKNTADLEIKSVDNKSVKVTDMLTSKEMSDKISLDSEGTLMLEVAINNDSIEDGNKPGEGEDQKPEDGNKPGEGEDQKPEDGNKPGEGEDQKPEDGNKPGEGEDQKPEDGNKPGDGEGQKPEDGNKPGDGEGQKPEGENKPEQDTNKPSQDGNKNEIPETGMPVTPIFVGIVALIIGGVLIKYSKKKKCN